jgi:hypothetical protein
MCNGKLLKSFSGNHHIPLAFDGVNQKIIYSVIVIGFRYRYRIPVQINTEPGFSQKIQSGEFAMI